MTGELPPRQTSAFEGEEEIKKRPHTVGQRVTLYGESRLGNVVTYEGSTITKIQSGWKNRKWRISVEYELKKPNTFGHKNGFAVLKWKSGDGTYARSTKR